MVNRQFLLIFLFVTLAFSFFAYQPIDVVIAGPQMTDLEKFKIELKSIEDSTGLKIKYETCLLYTSPSPRDATLSRMPSSA